MTFETKTAALPSGVRLPYVERGDPSGVPALLLHGLSDSWRSFERVLPHLPTSIRAIALSQRGHGDADRPIAGYDPRDFAADLAGFMDALGIAPAVIVGHSMGSAVAQRFVIEYPERARGLVLIGAFLPRRGNPIIQEFWETTVSTLDDPIAPDFALEFQRSTLAQPVPPEFLDVVVRESLKVTAHVWRAAVAGLLEADHSGELGKIRAPTLIVWGDQDTYSPRAEQAALAAAIAGSRLVAYAGAGHAPHWEEPERFAADLAAFAAGLAGGAGGRGAGQGHASTAPRDASG